MNCTVTERDVSLHHRKGVFKKNTPVIMLTGTTSTCKEAESLSEDLRTSLHGTFFHINLSLIELPRSEPEARCYSSVEIVHTMQRE